MRAYSADHVAIGRAIRRFREERGFSQEGFAHACGLDRTYMGGIERGERNFSMAKLLVICEVLGVRPSEVMRDFERLRGGE